MDPKCQARKESQVIQMTAISGSDDDADDSDAAIAQREVLVACMASSPLKRVWSFEAG